MERTTPQPSFLLERGADAAKELVASFLSAAFSSVFHERTEAHDLFRQNQEQKEGKGKKGEAARKAEKETGTTKRGKERKGKGKGNRNNQKRKERKGKRKTGRKSPKAHRQESNLRPFGTKRRPNH